MRIVLHDYSGSAFTFQIAEFLATQKNDVFYFHGGAMQAVQRSKLSSNINKLRVDAAKIKHPFAKYSLPSRWLQENEYGRNLVKKIGQINPGIVISATSPLDSQNLLIDWTTENQKKFFFWWQDISSMLIKNVLTRHSPIGGWLIGTYYQRIERTQLRRSQRVIAIAEEFRPLYRQWGLDESKFHVLPNWAPLEEIPLLPKDNPWARRQGLQDKFVFLYSGVLALKHNPGLLLALADHFAARPEVRLVVVSQGPGADFLLAHPRSNLLVLPFQPYEEYPSVLASADVLLAVLEEQAGAYSVPSKVLSYLCAGRPTLLAAPAANQAARLLREQNAGLVTDPGLPQEFCYQAKSLFNNPDKCHQFGQNARRYAENSFDLGKIGACFLEILASA